MISDTVNRVAEHTPPEVNEKIQSKTEMNIKFYGAHPEIIGQRLEELDREWDIERLLEANGSALLLLGLALGIFVDRKWLAVPALVGGFCLQHAVQGWCPPIEVFRRRGVRTATEIEEERIALKAIRGDFQQLPIREDFDRNFNDVLNAVRK
jgi:hypothetical protein